MYIRVFISTIVCALLLHGAYLLYFEVEYNRCVMTYMYELPRYHKMDLPYAIRKQHPKYGLYFYGEGNYYNNYRNAKTLTGIPVLFIPGNAGSYRQVRSMGSVALRMAESKKSHFNYFSVDFNEELSALSGDLLNSQTKFVVLCIQQILTLYKAGISVAIIGHSMGGVIARNLFHSPGFQPSWVHTIITQATPHRLPVIPVDEAMRRIYDRLDGQWRLPYQHALSKVTLVSLTGGSRDLQVRDGLGDLSAYEAIDGRALWRSTSAVRGAWASTDHLCAVWCKQIVMNLNRALFDMIDPKTNQLDENPRRRMEVFRRHLTSKRRFGSAGTVRLDSAGSWIYKTRRMHFQFSREEMPREMFIKIGPFSSEPFNAVLVANEVKGRWLFLCSSKNVEDPCREGKDVSSWGMEAPPYEISRRIVHLDGSKFRSSTSNEVFLVIRLEPTKKEVEIFFEHFSRSQRFFDVSPSIISYVASLTSLSSLSEPPGVPQTEQGALYYRLFLPGLYHIRQGLGVKATVVSCSGTAGSVGFITLSSPWDNHFVHSSIWYYSNASLDLLLATSRPSGVESKAFVELLLDPTCQYKVELNYSPGLMASQFLKIYAPLLPAYVLMHILFGVFLQLNLASKGEDIPIIYRVKQAFPIIVASIIGGFILNSLPIPLPKNDFRRLQEEGLHFPLAQQLLFLVGMAVFLLLTGVMRLLVELLALPLCGLGDRFLCRAVARLVAVATALCSLGLGLRVCGGAAVLLLLLGQLLLTAMHRAAPAEAFSFRLRFSVLLLFSLLAILTGPGLAVWGKAFMESNFTRLPPPVNTGALPSIAAFSFLALSNADLALWRRAQMLARVVAAVVVVLAVLAPLFAAFSFHRLAWGIVTALSAMGSATLVMKATRDSKRTKTE